MPTITVDPFAPDTVIPGPQVGKPTVAAGPEADPTWAVHVVNMAGTLATNITANCDVDWIQWTLNAPDEAEFHFSKGAFSASQITALGNGSGPLEIQIYRNGDLLFWGPIVSLDAEGSKGEVTCRCMGVDWYLNRRYLDGTISNIISGNADFESGTGSWTNVNVDSFTVDTNQFEVGSQSAKLVNSSSEDAYITQVHTAVAGSIGTLLTLSGWFFIDNFVGPAFATSGVGTARGLYLAGVLGGVVQNGPNGQGDWYVIDNATARGKWTKASVTCWIPPNQTWSIQTRCYALNGTIHWDDIKLAAMYSVSGVLFSGGSLVPQPADISHIVPICIRHLQDTTVGKSNLNIGVHTEATGTLMSKVYQYVDHIQWDQALREFTERHDGIDYYMAITPTSRVFHCFAHKRGTDLSGSVTLKYVAGDATSNCTDYRFTEDGGNCVTRQVVLGSDNGPDREQGEDADASAIGGTILQDVRQAPQDASVATLQPFAEDLLTKAKTIPRNIEMDVIGAGGLIPTIHCGDLVKVDISDGWTTVSNVVMRIMRLKLDRRKNLLTVTCATDDLS